MLGKKFHNFYFSTLMFDQSKPLIFNLFQTDSKYVNFNKTNQDYDFRILLFKISWYKPTLYSPKKRLLNRGKLESDREMRKLLNQKFEFSREINLKIAHRWYRTPWSVLRTPELESSTVSHKKFRRAFSLTDVVQNEIFIWERFPLDNYFNLLWTYQIHNLCWEAFCISTLSFRNCERSPKQKVLNL